MLVLKDNGGGPTLEAGSYLSTCVQVVEMGTLTETFQGQDPKEVQKIALVFELDGEATSEGKQYTRFVEYTASLGSKAKIRKHLEAWRGKAFTEEELQGFTLDKLLGQPALVTLNEKGYIAAVAKPMKGQKAAHPVTTPIAYLSLDPKEFNKEDYATLPEFMQNKIATSPEWTDCISGAVASTAKGPVGKPQPEDDIPF